MLKSLKLYLEGQYKSLVEHRRNEIPIGVDILNKFYALGDLSSLNTNFVSKR